MATLGFLADESRLRRCRRVVAYQVTFCIKLVHAVDENGTADLAITPSVLVCLEEAVFELWRHDAISVCLLPSYDMMVKMQTYLSADIRRAADREVLGESAGVLAGRVLHGAVVG